MRNKKIRKFKKKIKEVKDFMKNKEYIILENIYIYIYVMYKKNLMAISYLTLKKLEYKKLDKNY